MNYNFLNKLLDLPQRNLLYKEILNNFRQVNGIENVRYKEFIIEDGIIPVIKISEHLKLNEIETVKVFLAAQHNEYNGLFGILEFFNDLIEGKVNINSYLKKYQVLFFFPLMNPYGLLYPNIENKSGYYLKTGENLNRFWRRTFVPEYKGNESDLSYLILPEQTKILKNVIEKYWLEQNIKIYFMDFHETSLLQRYMLKLNRNLNYESYTYKFSHWIEERIIWNIIKLFNIPYRKPLFKKCSSSSNHSHINLSPKEIELLYEKLQEYLIKNNKKMPFYYCHSKNAYEYCEHLAQKVYNKLKSKLWETKFLTYNHKFDEHGCFIKMSDATKREHVYSMELESRKEFFNIFEEIEKAKSHSNYYEEKLDDIKIGIELAYNTIVEMIQIF